MGATHSFPYYQIVNYSTVQNRFSTCQNRILFHSSSASNAENVSTVYTLVGLQVVDTGKHIFNSFWCMAVGG